MDFLICWKAFNRAKAKAARSLKGWAQNWHNIKFLFKRRKTCLDFLMGGVSCMERRKELVVVIFMDNSPGQETERVTKTERKNNLETRSRLMGDLDVGDFKKELEYLRVVMMELTVSN